MTLYEMTGAAKELYDLFETEDLPEEAIADTLENLGVDGKIEDYCKVINQFNADISMYKAEIDRLTAKKQSAEKAITRMKDALTQYMLASRTTNIQSGTFNLSFRKSESVIIKNENALPTEFVVEEIKYIPNKSLIKKAIKEGQAVAGAELQKNKNLQIK